MENIKVTNCSLGCMYATGELEKCQCKCKGSMHGLMVPATESVTCSPAAEKRCKDGTEGGTCVCACGGQNHGLYHEIEDFEGVRITGYAY